MCLGFIFCLLWFLHWGGLDGCSAFEQGRALHTILDDVRTTAKSCGPYVEFARESSPYVSSWQPLRCSGPQECLEDRRLSEAVVRSGSRSNGVTCEQICARFLLKAAYISTVRLCASTKHQAPSTNQQGMQQQQRQRQRQHHQHSSPVLFFNYAFSSGEKQQEFNAIVWTAIRVRRM